MIIPTENKITKKKNKKKQNKKSNPKKNKSFDTSSQLTPMPTLDVRTLGLTVLTALTLNWVVTYTMLSVKRSSSLAYDRTPLHHLDLGRAQCQQPLAAATPPGDGLVYQIVLTGGPRGGKSSCMARLERILREDHGFDVYVCPEVPTLLMNAGARYPGMQAGSELLAFEVGLVELQLQMELSFHAIAASTGRPSVIIYDRGLLDFAAYTPVEQWGLILNHNAWLCEGIIGCAEKYDLVLHMESAAVGAEKNFKGRSGEGPTREEVLEAKELDKRVLTCWRGHPHHRVVDNSTNFEQKLQRATKHVLELCLNHRLL